MRGEERLRGGEERRGEGERREAQPNPRRQDIEIPSTRTPQKDTKVPVEPRGRKPARLWVGFGSVKR